MPFKVLKFVSIVVFGAISGLALAGPAAASTISESHVAGGAFSPSWFEPTVIGAGVTSVTGTGAGGAFDNLVFTDLPQDATLTFTFAAPEGIGYSYAAGGTILFSTSPFRYGWDGTTLASFGVGYWQPGHTFALDLDDTVAGPLYLALNFTYGSDLAYSIDVASDLSSVAAVPLPATSVLFGTLLGVLGLTAVSRRRKASL